MSTLHSSNRNEISIFSILNPECIPRSPSESGDTYWGPGDFGDSRDSFCVLSESSFSLPPTPPSTPPNSVQEIPSGGSGKFSCNLCPRVFGDRAHLLEHHRYRHSEERPYQCPHCYKGFKSRSNVKQHVRTSHERPRFDCKLCNRTSFTESGYRYHLLTAHPQPDGQRTFECSVCSKTFVQQKLLKKHFNSRHAADSVRLHNCPFCPATFKRKDHATRHVTDIHSLVAKLFDCSHCGAKFQSASRLRQHERLHEERGSFHECHICRKRIVRKKNLRKHLALHAGSTEVSVIQVPNDFSVTEHYTNMDFVCSENQSVVAVVNTSR